MILRFMPVWREWRSPILQPAIHFAESAISSVKPAVRTRLRPRPPCANVPLISESQISKVVQLGFLRCGVILSVAVFQAKRRISGSAGPARKPKNHR
jgi:hypothetical protein